MTRGPLESQTCDDEVLPALRAAGWQAEQIRPQVTITPGRFIGHGTTLRRTKPGVADYVLEISPGVPVAVVEAKRAYLAAADGVGQAIRYAEALDVPLAYATNGSAVVLRDLAAGIETSVAGFVTPAEAWARLVEVSGLSDAASQAVLQSFSTALRNADGSIKNPRPYQQVAIHRALRAVLGGGRRALLLMATGTGKTFTALQIVAKLRSYWRATDPRGNHRVLYLADRDWLVTQPQGQFERAFGADAVKRIHGQPNLTREVYFATYQALDREALFTGYPPDFFDLVVVDECHRGSANDTSTWRAILDHFSRAVQLGLTATPKSDANGDTYEYFGDPVFEYSLRQGITDGYLAPYRVRRAQLDVDATGWRPDPGQLDDTGREIEDREYRLSDFERALVLPDRTRTVARHMARILRHDPGARAVVFCVNSDHAARMRQELINAAPDLSAADNRWAVRIVSAEPMAREYLEEFADPTRTSPVVATTSRMLSTGVDLEDLRYVVLFRQVNSMVEFKQIVGRGTRLYPEKGKTSFEIIDYVGATRHFADPAFDGRPDSVTTTCVTPDGDESDTTTEGTAGADGTGEGDDSASDPFLDPSVAEDPAPYEAGGSSDDSAERPAIAAFVVDGVAVHIVSEGVYLHDRSGSAPRLVEYIDYAGEQVRRLAPTLGDFRRAWSRGPTRSEIVEELAARRVDLERLEELVGVPGIDAFDVLARAAWRTEPETRAERVRRVREGRAGRLAEFAPAAREVLDALLDRYADHGVDEFDDLASLDQPPIDRLGSLPEIAGRFGGPTALRSAIDELQSWLYAS